MGKFNPENGIAPSEKFAPDSVDRALIGGCATAWLLALGAGVAAIVALVDLGRGHSGARPGESGTPWLLYSVIAVSVVVIALAVPLLLRARRNELSNSPHGPVARAATPLSAERALRAAGYPGPVPNRFSSSVISDDDLDRLWLRGGIGVLTATGVAMTAVAAATYLMAVGSDGVGWAIYAVAGVVTVAMIAIPVVLVQQLRAKLAAADVDA